jgi:hypothetical protein
MVGALMVNHSESINIAWEQECESVLIKIATKYQIPREEISTMRSELREAGNQARKKSIEQTKRKLRQMQNAVSVKRERGQHD